MQKKDRLAALRLVYQDADDAAPTSFTLAAASQEKASERLDAFKERLLRLGFAREARFYKHSAYDAFLPPIESHIEWLALEYDLLPDLGAESDFARFVVDFLLGTNDWEGNWAYLAESKGRKALEAELRRLGLELREGA